MRRLILFFLLSGLLVSCGRKPDKAEKQTVRQKQATEAIISTENKSESKLKESIITMPNISDSGSVTVKREFVEQTGTLLPIGTNLPFARNDSVSVIEKRTDEFFFRIPKINSNSLISISLNIDNDIFTNTDYYYTHGSSISITGLSHRFYRALPGLGLYSDDSFGISLHQDLFTPINPEATDVVPNDRPFAGMLYFRFKKQSVLPKSRIQLRSEWVIGTIGPSSLGEKIQQSIHELEPTGWAYQIQDDLLLNLNLELEKAIIADEFFEVSAAAGIKAGSMNTGALASAKIVTGKLNPRNNPYIQSFKEKQDDKNFYYHFFVSPSLHFVVHNASLNGGWINSSNPHSFKHSEIMPLVGSVQAGLCLSYLEWDLNMYLNYLSPELTGGRDHRWGGIGITYYLK
jgi:lipid A 3-O-deacylase